jgi:ribonucleoside-diphosphate reductase alpha chain
MQGASPYEGVVFCDFPYSDVGDGRRSADQPIIANIVEFPETWSAESQSVVVGKCLVRGGISAQLVAVAEEDMPTWLWRHEPDESVTRDSATPAEMRGETALVEAIDRIAGAWTYTGWKGGYFDAEQDARAFFDEMRWLLCHQKLSPSLGQWQATGLYWAYGIRTDRPDTYVTDFRTGSVRRADAGDLPPHGATINSTHGALAGEGGVWDLWQREGRILSDGGQCGVNVSAIGDTGQEHPPQPLADILRIGDAAATLSNAPALGGGYKRPNRRITIDATHADSSTVADLPIRQMGERDATVAGAGIVLRHIQAILDSAVTARSTKRPVDAAMRFALQSARQANLPERLIQRTLASIEQAYPVTAQEILGMGAPDDATQPALDDSSLIVFSFDDDAMNNGFIGTARPARLIDAIARNGWMGLPSGIQFENTANGWNTCAESGSIKAASGDGSYLFLDDTSSAPAILNAAAFLQEDGNIDVANFSHAADLLTVALDISLMISTHPTPRLAKRTWDFRPLSLSITGVAAVIMAHGLAYDSDEARALCRNLHALLTATGYMTSARLAEEAGAFPEYARNASALQVALERHQQVVDNNASSENSEYLSIKTKGLWSFLQELDKENGFRNAHVSVVTPAEDESLIVGSETCGLGAPSTLFRFLRQGHGSYHKSINPVVPTALRRLGYSDKQVDGIVRHVCGRGSLVGAPGVNHETLKRRGFTDAALRNVEAALVTCFDISQVFTSTVLSAHYCRHMLGFAREEMEDEQFDMLAALGFSDAGIEAANVFCCGANTLEGAPHLVPEHLSVFDCTVPQGDRGHRKVAPEAIVAMMAAAQPAISGATGHIAILPATATLDDCRDMIFRAWRSGLKSFVFQRRSDDSLIPVTEEYESAGDAPLTLIPGGQSQITLSDKNAVQAASALEIASSNSDFETAITEPEEIPAGDAETPRRATSLPTRGTASVASSADAVVEQRQV